MDDGLEIGKRRMAFLVVLLYCLVMGTAWSVAFHRRYIDSLAPALITHCLLVLVSGMLFTSLLPGFIGGAIVGLGIVLYDFIKKSRNGSFRDAIEETVSEAGLADLLLFVGLFTFLYVLSTGKRFTSWDEWSHWGRFWKECLRLNALYATSNASMGHQDYVPGATLFEYIVSRLSFRIVEADAYRAQQILMLSMILPIVAPFLQKAERPQTNESEKEHRMRRVKVVLLAAGAVTMLLALPLLFLSDLGFQFYHTVYCDYIFGVALFYAFWQCFTNNDFVYKIIVSTLSLTYLVMIKMTAIVFLPMIVPVLFVSLFFFHQDTLRRIQQIALSFLSVAVPLGGWLWFNRYVRTALGIESDTQVGYQSYSAVDFRLVWNIFFHPGRTDISYIDTVRANYSMALNSYIITMLGTYMSTMILITLLMTAVAILSRWVPVEWSTIIGAGNFDKDSFGETEEKEIRQRMIYLLLAAAWVLLAGIANALLMYYLYCTAFSEYEAVNLASFGRYMDTYLVGAVLIFVAVWFTSGVTKRFPDIFVVMWFIIAIDLIGHPTVFHQMLPGKYANDEKIISEYENMADNLAENIGEADSVYIMSRSDNGFLPAIEGYYLLPHNIAGGSIGPACYEGDIWSEDISVEEFIERVSGYDWLYLENVDDVFLQKYADAFPKKEMIESDALYRVQGVDASTGKLEMTAP